MINSITTLQFIHSSALLAQSSFGSWQAVASHPFLVFTILLLILMLSWIVFIKNKSNLKKLQSEKEKLENELEYKIRLLVDEKKALEGEHEKNNTILFENRRVIETLSQKLKEVTEQYDDLKNEFDLNRVQELYTEIKELLSRNKALESLLENTYNKIYEKDKILGTLESEITSMKHPEVYIDFQKKVIRNRGGSEFTMSSAAQQYKNDVFRYLEYMVRNGRSRVHLIEFGLNDPKFYIEAVEQDMVREYNYEGKFAKVKSGINRTFRDNTGKELIVHDHEKIYAYCVLPETVLRITSKDKDVEIVLSDINRNKMPEVLTFFGYETFDYYKINSEIVIKSNIQDSADYNQKALETDDMAEKVSYLETALTLDDRNYDALSLLLDCYAIKHVEIVQAMQANIARDIENYNNFLKSKILYRKKITNMNRIKQEYKEIYSWKYVDASKSERFRKLGEITFDIVMDWEIKRIKKKLDAYGAVADKIGKYFDNLKKLESLHAYFQPLLDESILAKVILDFAEEKEGAAFLKPGQQAQEGEMRKGFVRYLVASLTGKTNQSDVNSTVLASTVDFVEWLHQGSHSQSNNIMHDLKLFFQERGTSKSDQIRMEKTVNLFLNAQDLF
jgi:hypothetical protein